MQIIIREALPAELAAAGELTAAVYRDESLAEAAYLPRLADAAARHAADGAWQLIAVDEAGRLLGAAVYTVAGSEFADIAAGTEAELRMLATAGSARGLGVGAALVQDCVRRSRQERRPALVLSTKPEMTAAQRLYARLGFSRTPERDWEYAPGKGLLTFRLVTD
ncbi:GCN5-related N-acetyltransferase [Catenulispora acidiphila DSM 44928]|uniref:GCN5-related N-acetyltransferase n=1 Tax=Catenulispora acidiphila (strain DSM 44928 / JCM 14897 / NBRC 102108 / NRRL B-24433 / ID139908) TaxID=479433 RepID=C7PY36_CATAD|nr:GNAT family N-acetyltransferase [Catenulispora acidiphila]ACU73496.1 GCN5-related N-acetyltransferase [Catenulispora acidiphila DSM 44928]